MCSAILGPPIQVNGESRVYKVTSLFSRREYPFNWTMTLYGCGVLRIPCTLFRDVLSPLKGVHTGLRYLFRRFHAAFLGLREGRLVCPCLTLYKLNVPG